MFKKARPLSPRTLGRAERTQEHVSPAKSRPACVKLLRERQGTQLAAPSARLKAGFFNIPYEKSPVLSLKDAHVSDSIAGRIQTIRERIREAALRVGRDPVGIRLVAATKTVSPAGLEEAYAAGVRTFGENRLQEAQEKRRILGLREGLVWHFIGRMQRRKLKEIVGNFGLLHSVESLEQANSINAAAEKLGIRQKVLLEVNVAGEDSKGGFTPQELEAGIEELDLLPHVDIRGLMTLPPWKENPEDVRPYFTHLGQLRNKLARHAWTRVRMDELSMGMSHDYEIAIEEGATMVRIGTAIFGIRE